MINLDLVIDFTFIIIMYNYNYYNYYFATTIIVFNSFFSKQSYSDH